MRKEIDVASEKEILDTVNTVLNNRGIVELHIEPFFDQKGEKKQKIVAVEVQRKLLTRFCK